MDEMLLTSDQVAELLQVRPQTVRDAAWRGKLPCVRLWQGRKKSLLRFRKSEIDDWIRQKSIPAVQAKEFEPVVSPGKS